MQSLHTQKIGVEGGGGVVVGGGGGRGVWAGRSKDVQRGKEDNGGR